jgi:hypothetical protein
LADANRSRPDRERADVARGGERGERAIGALGSGVRRLGRWASRFARESIRAWRYLDGEQRVAALASLLLIVSTFGPFSFVEAAIVLVALAVLLLLKKRADGRSFHLPFGDGAVILAAGAWSALLIVVRLFDRPLGQNLLALVCATLLALAGLRMRLRRPMDDLPAERARGDAFVDSGGADAGEVEIEFAPPTGSSEELTEALPERREETRVRPSTPAARSPAPPPEEPPGPFRARPAPPDDA